MAGQAAVRPPSHARQEDCRRFELLVPQDRPEGATGCRLPKITFNRTRTEMTRRISNSPQGPSRRSVLPNTGAGARSQTINGPQTVDEGVAPLSTSPRTPRRFIESGGGGFGDSPPRRNRSSQINFFTIADVAE